MSTLFAPNTPAMLRITNDGVVVLFGYSHKGGDKHTVYACRIPDNAIVRTFEKIIDYKELILCNQDGQINFGHIRDRFRLARSGEKINSIYLMRDSQDLIRVREVGNLFLAERWPYSFSRIFGDSISNQETAEGTVICLYRSGVEIAQFGPFSGGIFQNPFVSKQQKLMVH